ncbi:MULTISPECIES: DUF4148 domain-containing protein [unclassified Polaromonas]|uniref:DUF4148 domain-containing protein n=1 Tax=unclassified Polaromonas TaxID=2638319 RepID=UPI0018CB07E9|nr:MULTISPECIES: DUF4148 domain-containing protein [unclassified Polaromonas]MBG6073802.1 hypothetical protein [Polaromonas sp. CG_9.7]MBG6115896.1 hypothetical protein [Polaromonas sp. CG_9.2]MDH6185950.1 hypothetical protein [Polaromonas sp. CG_23.6]
MSIRKTIVALALVAAAVPAAFANSHTGWAGNERGVSLIEANTSTSTKTRAEVVQELQAFRNNPVTSDGSKLVDNERRVSLPRHSYAFQGGALVHTDTIAHNTAKPSVVLTDAEKRRNRELYRR